eukprot:1180433-Prorocentrum_minimum.AAC.2
MSCTKGASYRSTPQRLCRALISTRLARSDCWWGGVGSGGRGGAQVCGSARIPQQPVRRARLPEAVPRGAEGRQAGTPRPLRPPSYAQGSSTLHTDLAPGNPVCSQRW